jgi:DNA-directed RNA polymerase subunit RPC12/RpoP
MSGMEGICTTCGAHYYGWALQNPLAQRCGKCGGTLAVSRDGVPMSPGYFSLRAAATMELTGPRLTVSQNLDLLQN